MYVWVCARACVTEFVLTLALVDEIPAELVLTPRVLVLTYITSEAMFPLVLKF